MVGRMAGRRRTCEELRIRERSAKGAKPERREIERTKRERERDRV
jgi:hypothetical protein